MSTTLYTSIGTAASIRSLSETLMLGHDTRAETWTELATKLRTLANDIDTYNEQGFTRQYEALCNALNVMIGDR